jgi:hypothetical protein
MSELTNEETNLVETVLVTFRELYFKYIENVYLNRNYLSKLHEYHENNSDMVDKILRYISNKSSEKLGFPIIITDDDVHQFTTVLSQFLYLGFSVGPNSDYFRNRGDTKLNLVQKNKLVNMGYRLDYFIWRKVGDDEAIRKPDRNISITDQNINMTRINNTQNWTNKQYETYFNINIVRPISERIGIPNLKIDYSYYYNQLIFLFAKDNSILFNDKFIEIIKNGNIDEFDTIKELYINNFHEIEDESVLYKKLYFIKNFLESKKRYLEKKDKNWDKLKESISDKSRFKWQRLCRPKHFQKNFNIDELRMLAEDEGIPQHLFLTKGELCAELAQRFTNVIEGKKKIVPKCINTTSITLTDLEDIPPEFFYSYIHDNKIYCDDIRDLKTHFDTSGAHHPIDRSPVSQQLVNSVYKWYNNLQKSTISMKDVDEEQVYIPVNNLSSKLASFTSLLNYPANIHLYSSSQRQTIDIFVNELVKENILYTSEKNNLERLTDLTSYKIALLDTLQLKIMNDPEYIIVGNNRLSTIAINISNVWNEIFGS